MKTHPILKTFKPEPCPIKEVNTAPWDAMLVSGIIPKEGWKKPARRMKLGKRK